MRIGGGHRIRKMLFLRGIRDGHLNVDEVEVELPEGLMTSAERWLLYFSLRAAEVELRDSQGHVVTPDDLVPEHRQQRRRALGHHHRPMDFGPPDDVGVEEQLP